MLAKRCGRGVAEAQGVLRDVLGCHVAGAGRLAGEFLDERHPVDGDVAVVVAVVLR